MIKQVFKYKLFGNIVQSRFQTKYEVEWIIWRHIAYLPRHQRKLNKKTYVFYRVILCIRIFSSYPLLL